MLDGPLEIDVVADRELRAGELVSFCNRRFCGGDRPTDTGGAYEGGGDGIFAALDVVLNCKGPQSEPGVLPLGLRGQALPALEVLSASSVGPSHAGRYADLHLERQAVIDSRQLCVQLPALPLTGPQTGQDRLLGGLKLLPAAMNRRSAGHHARAGILGVDCSKAWLPIGALAGASEPRAPIARGPSLADRRPPWPKAAPASTDAVVRSDRAQI